MLHVMKAEMPGQSRLFLSRILLLVPLAFLAAVVTAQVLQVTGVADFGFGNWRPTLYAYLLAAAGVCLAQPVRTGEYGMRTLFILPPVFFVLSLAIIPLVFGLVLAFSDWNLSSSQGRTFNGLDNLRQLASDRFFWGALTNMVWYCLAILPEYAIAFGLALMLNSQIAARKFFRVAFLLPMMLSPVAVSWMIGKSMFVTQPAGPVVHFLQAVGIDRPTFYSNPWTARAIVMMLDAWIFIPFLMIMLLAGLQAIPKDVQEASRVDGAKGWRSFWEITFPLMLPVSVTAILIRLIFKLKLADLVITLTGGGPGGATDTVTSFIYREYRERSNVGYGTLLAIVYLVVIVILMTFLTKSGDRITNRDGRSKT